MDTDGIDNWLTPDDRLDLNNCDREPIHIPGSIQPHGALFALADTGELVLASENLREFLGEEEGADVRALLSGVIQESEQSSERFAMDIQVKGGEVTAIVHRRDALRIFELEPRARVNMSHTLTTINRASSALEQATTRQQAYDIMVKEVRALTGFDRVFAYEFDHEGHGEVVASVTAPGIDDFMNLRFPNTDIPKQARQLYKLELTRSLVDVDGAPVALAPAINPVTRQPLNMASCQLRSVSPIHIKYLKNMGVCASFSISLVIQDELVALIACHHYSPRHIDYHLRQACELLARMSSHQLARQNEQQLRTLRNKQLSAQVELLSDLGEDVSVSTKSPAWERAFNFIEAEALLIHIGDERHILGSPPEDLDAVWGVASQLHKEAGIESAHTESLQEFDAQSHGGGLLLVPIAQLGWLAWYRAPRDRMVVWGGDPHHDSTKSLEPRSSFDAWRERVQGLGRRWDQADIEMAEILRRGLLARFDPEHLAEGDAFERAMQQLREYVFFLDEQNQALYRVSDDLRQFAYAASHDLRSPLRTIRSFLPLVREHVAPYAQDETLTWFEYIEDAADTLYRLQEGLWAFSRVNRVNHIENIDLNMLIQRVIAEHATGLAGAKVQVGQMPPLRGVASQIETLFGNLVDNAIKYKHSERPLRLVIAARKKKGDWVMSVSDNGIGFPAETSERIFEIFTRVHADRAHGDGMGLALGRRIVHHHQGWIRASSEPGQGSRFEFCLREPRAPSAPAQ